MGVSSCPMIGSYRPLRQTGKNSVCIRRIVCIRLSYQSGGCKSVESSFTGRALETSSKIEDCKGSPSLERGDGPATAARKEVLLLLQAKAGRQKDGRPLLPFFLFCYCCFLWQQQRGGREELGCWLVVGASGGGVAARDGRRGRVKKVGRRGGARRNKRSVSRGSIACFCSSSSSFSSFSSSSSPSSSTSSSKKGRGASAS